MILASAAPASESIDPGISLSPTASSAVPTLSETDASNPTSIPLTTAGFAPLAANTPVAELLTNPSDMVGAEVPAPIRDTLGATIVGPQNTPLQFENPDFLAPPSTDAGNVQNAKWPFTLSHNRLQTGGWARQENSMYFSLPLISVIRYTRSYIFPMFSLPFLDNCSLLITILADVMPIATTMAGVNMRLEPGSIRCVFHFSYHRLSSVPILENCIGMTQRR